MPARAARSDEGIGEKCDWQGNTENLQEEHNIRAMKHECCSHGRVILGGQKRPTWYVKVPF